MFSVSVCSSMCSGSWAGRGGRYSIRPPPWYCASMMHQQYRSKKPNKHSDDKTRKSETKTDKSCHSQEKKKDHKSEGKKSPLSLFDGLKDKFRDKPKIDFNKIKEDKNSTPVLLPSHLDSETKITVDERTVKVMAQDLWRISTLGSGAYGIVDKMEHQPTGIVMAVKRIPFTVNSLEQKQSLRDMDISMRASSCQYTVNCYGSLFWEGDIWIMMEEMDTSLDKFYKMVYENKQTIPEDVIAKIASSIIKGLYYLQSEVKVMHGDVKPSNMLISRNGDVKICDYGISGRLTDSVAKTIQLGSKPYMAPEKIEPEMGPAGGFDIRTDVWSLGISMLELATGEFPYPSFGNPFEQMKHVVFGETPRLPQGTFSPEFEDFISVCLQKNYKKRPKYRHLLKHPFIQKCEKGTEKISSYVTSVLDKYGCQHIDSAA